MNTLIGRRGSRRVEKIVIKFLTNSAIRKVCTLITVRKFTKHAQTRIISSCLQKVVLRCFTSNAVCAVSAFKAVWNGAQHALFVNWVHKIPFCSIAHTTFS